MSSIDMNEILNMPIDEVLEKHMDDIDDPQILELIKGIAMFRETLKNEKPIVFRLTYDPETMLVTGLIHEETTLPFIEITQEQAMSSDMQKRMKIVGTSYVVIDDPIPITSTPSLPLVEGEKWKTTEDNMLIMGNDKGWDERKGN